MCLPVRARAVAAWLGFDRCMEKLKLFLTKQLHQRVSSTKLGDSGLICFLLVQKTKLYSRPHSTAGELALKCLCFGTDNVKTFKADFLLWENLHINSTAGTFLASLSECMQ